MSHTNRKNSIKWSDLHLKQIKNKAGVRYTPELNINLPISEIFDGISRNNKFYTDIRSKFGELLREFRSIGSVYESKELQRKYLLIKTRINSFFKLVESVKDYNSTRIPWEKISKQSNTIEKLLWEFADKLREEKERVKDIKISPREDGSYQSSPSEKLNHDIHYIYEVQKNICYFKELSLSTKAKLSNNPFLLLTGPAGSGKTHLLCDLVEQRLKANLPAFLTFGEYFVKGDFWNQEIKQLGLNNSADKFLKEINLLGQRKQCRALVIVDALNENIEHVPEFWKQNLNKIVREIKKYPNIALVISVRNGFENEVLTENQKKIFNTEEHGGFRFKEWEAVNKFFSSFGLPLPEVPLLMPEFQRPLFLLLFCKAFTKSKNKKKKLIFKGHEGATFIFENYVDTISKKIEKNFGINHGTGKNVWDTVIEKIAERMVADSSDRISENVLIQIIKNSHPKIEIAKFTRALESNLIITKVPKYLDGNRIDGFDIRFPFQKFSDHLIGRYIFKKYENEFGKTNKNSNTAKKFFSSKRKLGKFILKGWNRGIIEALSVQTPEQLKGTEFLDVIPHLKKRDFYLDQVLDESFVESLIWRNPKAFSKDSKNTLDIINKRIIRTKSGHTQLLNAFLSVAPIPDHQFNAERLHQHLSKFPMSQRDTWWSTSFLHYQNGEHEAVDRLLQWAWSDCQFDHISDESIYLSSIALSWFLTTPNRFIRDRSTKGLVCLLQDRIHLVEKLLKKFEGINDPYITERLYAVAYGCVLRNKKDKKGLRSLAEYVYGKNFKDNAPTHILIRDYARGIVEVAVAKKQLNRPRKNFNPPYKSKWPNHIPKPEDIKKKYYPEDFFSGKTKDRGYLDIWSSVMYNSGTLGDFGNYVVNSDLHRWSGRKLKKPEPNRKELLDRFKVGLNSEQKKLLEKATNPFFGVNFKNIWQHIKISNPTDSDKVKLDEKEIEKEEKEKEEKQKQYFSDFKTSISKLKRRYFEKEIEPFLDSTRSVRDPFDDFNTDLAQAWIFNRVVELGYDPKLHGEFDSAVNRYDNTGRSEHKAERIGKKYQWIAYHEFMAMVSDHFEFKGDHWSNYSDKYKGPWTPFARDIDPSFVMQTDQKLRDVASFYNWKAGSGKYDAWRKIKSDTKWLQKSSDLPDPKQIIEIADDKNTNWLSLRGILVWQQETPPEVKKYDVPTREVFYILKSYIVKKQDYKKITSWVLKKGYGNWLPESHDFYECFIGEYPNSYAFNDLRGSYNIWTKSGGDVKEISVPVVVSDDSYLNEFTLDCSHSGSVSVRLPSKWLVNEMRLEHKYLDGRFYDKKGNLIVYTTSVSEEFFPSTLLIDKNALINFLKKNGYAIFWTLLGEKQMIGGDHQFKGRLDISGVYGIMPGKNLLGKMISKFEKPH